MSKGTNNRGQGTYVLATATFQKEKKYLTKMKWFHLKTQKNSAVIIVHGLITSPI